MTDLRHKYVKRWWTRAAAAEYEKEVNDSGGDRRFQPLPFTKDDNIFLRGCGAHTQTNRQRKKGSVPTKDFHPMPLKDKPTILYVTAIVFNCLYFTPFFLLAAHCAVSASNPATRYGIMPFMLCDADSLQKVKRAGKKSSGTHKESGGDGGSSYCLSCSEMFVRRFKNEARAAGVGGGAG